MNMKNALVCIFIYMLSNNLYAQTNESSFWKVDSLYSCVLCEMRSFCIYMPAHFDCDKKYPIIFSADGQMLVEDNYKAVLDSMIESELIPPVVLIGAYSNSQKMDGTNIEYRFYEYVERDIKDTHLRERFDNHSVYFTRELLELLMHRYHVKPASAYNIFYGCSNGGDYGMNLINQYPNVFTHFICFSPVSTVVRKNIVKNGVQSLLYLAYGTQELESIIGMNLRKLDKKLNKAKNPHVYSTVYDGGHDRNLWKKEFEKALIYIFKIDDSLR